MSSYNSSSFYILFRKIVFGIFGIFKDFLILLGKTPNIFSDLSKARKNKERLFDYMDTCKGKDIIILGASPSALDYRDTYSDLVNSEEVVVIGCNWTNYLDVDIDFFVSAYPWVCKLAKINGARVKNVLNPTLHGRYIGYDIVNIKRKNFRGDVKSVISKFMSKDSPLLYSNQNVLFLMINLAYSLSPRSISFCGFEGRDGKDDWVHFFSKDMSLKAHIVNDIAGLDDKDVLTNSTFGSTEEMLNVLIVNFCKPTFDSYLNISDQVSLGRQASLSKKRNELIDEFLSLSSEGGVPLYRIGKTTLFSELGCPPYLNK